MMPGFAMAQLWRRCSGLQDDLPVEFTGIACLGSAMATITVEDVRDLDVKDPSAPIRDLFELPAGVIFMDANSVGPMPKAVRQKSEQLLYDWVNLRRRGWSKRQWLDMPSLLGDAIAPLIGAGAGQIVFCDSTTLNQFKAVSHCLALRPERSTIVTQAGNFPTDIHVLQGLIKQSDTINRKLSLKFVEHEDAALAALDETVAVAALSHVDYRSGERWDMARITTAAHGKGALTVWDLSHSAGAVPVDVRAAGADFAIGCGYKYLCAGPGGPAYIYMKPGLGDDVWPAIAGWMGHADILGFARDYQPHNGVKQFLTGTPMVGANELASAMLEVWPHVNPQKLWKKHESLTGLLIALLEQECGDLGVEVLSPLDPSRRGGHVSFLAPGAGSVVEALIDEGVIASFRKPASIRFGISPLVIRHIDVFNAVAKLRSILSAGIWKRPQYAEVSV
jgi:kynureninase